MRRPDLHRADSARRGASATSTSCTLARSAALLWLLLCAVSPPSLRAAEYAASLTIDAEAEVNTNRRLVAGDTPIVFGGTVDLGTDFTARTERTELRLSPLLRFIRYTGEDGLDSDDQYLEVAASHRGERARLDLGLDLAHDSTLTSELLTTGSVFRRRRRDEIAASARAELDLTDRMTGSLGYRYATIEYDDGVSAGLLDYDYQVVAGSLVRRLSPVDEVFLAPFASRFDLPQIDAETDSFGGTVGYARRFDETLSVRLGVGGQVSVADFRVAGRSFDNTDTGMLLDFALQINLERSEVSLDARRRLQPTGQGALVNRDELELAALYRSSERLRWRVNVLAFRNRAQGTRSRRIDRDVIRVRVGVSHDLTPRLTASADYRYIRRDSDGIANNVDSNAAFVGLVFTPDPTVKSR